MKPNPIPEGYHTITPYLKLPDAGRLAEFLKKAFGGIERGRLLKPDGSLLHAEILIGDSLVMVHEAPPHWTPKPCTLYFYVEDVDATYRGRLPRVANPLLSRRICITAHESPVCRMFRKTIGGLRRGWKRCRSRKFRSGQRSFWKGEDEASSAGRHCVKNDCHKP
jgi:hypothetical protein